MILVTGASGFIGQHLLRRIAGSGQPIRALYNRHEPDHSLKALPGVEWMKADLLDVFDVEDAMRGVTHLYNCAAIVSFNPKRRDELIHTNVEITCNVVNAAIYEGVQRMLHVSSIAALGRDERSKHLIDEEAEWTDSKLNTAYAISKQAAEMEVWRGIAEGVDAVIINPGIILGPGNWEDEGSARLLKVADREFPFYTTGTTSFTGIDDVVEVMARLMQSNISAERFIVSTGNFSFRDIFTIMANALGKKPPHVHAGPFLSGLAWRLGRLRQVFTGKHPTITRETSRTAQNKSLYDNSKLLAALPGFHYTSIEDTITQMTKAYKKR